MAVETIIAGVTLGIAIVLLPVSTGGSIKASYLIIRTSALRERCLPHLILLVTSAVTSFTIICLEFIPILLLSLGIHTKVTIVLWMLLMPASKALMFSSMIYIGVERLRRCYTAFTASGSPLPGLFFITVSSLGILGVNIYKVTKINVTDISNFNVEVNITGPVQTDLVLPVDEQHTIMYSITLVTLFLIYIWAVVYIKHQGKKVGANRTLPSHNLSSRLDPNLFYMSSLRRPEIVPRERISSLGTDDMTCPTFRQDGAGPSNDDRETVRNTPVVPLSLSDDEQPTTSQIEVETACQSKTPDSSCDTYSLQSSDIIQKAKNKLRRAAKQKVVPLESKNKETPEMEEQGLRKIKDALRKLSSVSLFSVDPIPEVYSSQEENEIKQKMRLRPLKHTRRSAGNVWHSGDRVLSPVLSETTIGTDQNISPQNSVTSNKYGSARGSLVTDFTDHSGEVFSMGSKTKKYKAKPKRRHKRSKELRKQTSMTSMKSENSRASYASSGKTSCSDRHGTSSPRSKADSGCMDDIQIYNSDVMSDRTPRKSRFKISSTSADIEETSFSVDTKAAKQSNDEFIGTWEQLSTDIQNPRSFRRAHSLVNLNPQTLDYSTLSRRFPSENEPRFNENLSNHLVSMQSCSTQTDDNVVQEIDPNTTLENPRSTRPVIIKITRPSQASSNSFQMRSPKLRLPSNVFEKIYEHRDDSPENRSTKGSVITSPNSALTESSTPGFYKRRSSHGSALSDVDFYLPSPEPGIFPRGSCSLRSSRSSRRTMSTGSCTFSKKDMIKSVKTSCMLVGMFLVLYLPHTIMFTMSAHMTMKTWSIMCPIAVLLEFIAAMLNSYFYVYTNSAVMKRIRHQPRGQ